MSELDPIKVTFEGDSSSLQDAIKEASDALESMNESMEKSGSGADGSSMAEAFEKASVAAQKGAESLQRQAGELDKTSAKMKATGMSALELRSYIEQLTKAREAAAAAGDAEGYQRLTEQIKIARGAMGDLSINANTAKTALLSKAQAGMQLASTLSGLASKANEGTLSMGDLASGVLAVSVAIKSGLGPVGWLMTAIQLLSVAIEKFAGSQEKAAESTKKAYEELRKLNDELGKYAVAVAKAAADEIDAQTDKQIKSVQRLTENKLKYYDRDAQAERDRMAANLSNTQQRFAQREKELAQMVKLGKISEAQAQQEIDMMNRTLSELKERTEAREREIQQGRLDIIREGQEREREIYIESSNKFEAKYGKKFFSAYTDEIDKKAQSLLRQAEQLEARLKALGQQRETTAALMQQAHDTGNERMEKFYQNELDKIDGEISAAKATLQGVERRTRATLQPVLSTLKDSAEFQQVEGADLVRAVLEVRRIRDRYSSKVTEMSDALFETETAAQTLDRQATLAEQGTKVQEGIVESKKREEDAARAIAQREQRWAIVQQQSYEEQEEWLEDLLSQLQAGTEAHAKWSARLQDVREKALDHEWKMVKASWTLENQQRWLVEQMSKMEEGSVLWSKYNEKLAKITSKLEGSLEKEIDGICKELKASKDYTKKSKKDELEIFKADKQILERRLAKLQQLKAQKMQEEEPDPEGLRKINDAIAHTQAELRGLQSAVAASAAEARKWIRALQPPKLEAAKKGTQKHLENLAKAYQNAAKRFNKAAAKGDTKGMERARHSMDLYAKSMENLSKRPHEIAKYHEEVTSKTRTAAAAADDNAKSERRTAKASARTAKAKEQSAKAAERQATAAAATGTKIETLDSSVQNMNATLQQLARGAVQLNTSLGEVAPILKQLADSFAQFATETRGALASMRKSIATITREVDKIKARV